MRPIRVLFEAYYMYHLPQFLPFFELIKNDPRFDIWLTTNCEEKHAFERTKAVTALEKLGKPIILGTDEPARWAEIDTHDFDYMFIGWGRMGYMYHVKERPRPAIIMIYHGIGVKASYYNDADPRIDYRVVESPYRRDQLKRHGITSQLLLTGFLKLDPLLSNQSAQRESVLRALDLDPSRKTILYAPTFYPSSIGAFKNRIAEAARDCNLIIKMHDYTRYRPRYNHDLRVLERMAARYPGVRVTPPEWYNISDIFPAADLMISDASSVIFEYLALDRPVIVLTKHRLKLHHRLIPWDYRKRKIDDETKGYDYFYDKCDSPRALAKLVELNLREPGRLAKERARAFDELLHFRDGNSARRMLAEFEGILRAKGHLA